MAEISAIKLPDNVTYDLADDTARAALSVISITIPANMWFPNIDYWYTKVDVSGVTSSDNYEIVGFTPSSTMANNAIIKEQLGYITCGETTTDSIKFVAVKQAPTIDLPIVIRRVL